MKEVKGAGILFYCPEDQTMFLVLRGPTGDFENTWSVPGGGLQKGEGELEAALRECKEELGCLPPSCTVRGSCVTNNPVHYRTFRADVDKESKEKWRPTLNKENYESKWVKKIPSERHPSTENIVQKLILSYGS